MEGRIRQIKVQQDGLSPIAAFGPTISKERSLGDWLVLWRGCEDVKTHLGIGPLILEALMPGTHCKNPQGVAARTKIRQLDRFSNVVDGLVGLVVQHQM
jgi:hypothetical protein